MSASLSLDPPGRRRPAPVAPVAQVQGRQAALWRTVLAWPGVGHWRRQRASLEPAADSPTPSVGS